MKCRKCGRDMRRQKTDDRRFIYVCPVCGTKVASSNSPEPPESEYEQAFNIVMGKEEK